MLFIINEAGGVHIGNLEGSWWFSPGPIRLCASSWFHRWYRGGLEQWTPIRKVGTGGEFSITVEFLSKKDNLKWLYMGVYGPNERAHKQDFWGELRRCRCASPLPWVICGDFNAIFAVEDEPSGNPNLADIRCANAFMQDLGLLEARVLGRKFS